jgi:hypothetical protein
MQNAHFAYILHIYVASYFAVFDSYSIFWNFFVYSGKFLEKKIIFPKISTEKAEHSKVWDTLYNNLRMTAVVVA